MSYIIGDYNRKGGVGKTSSLINLAAQFALEGSKVLLIDGDSQMNLTQYFFDDDENYFDENGMMRKNIPTIYDFLTTNISAIDIVQKCVFSVRRRIQFKFKNMECCFDLIPGSADMDYFAGEDLTILKQKCQPLKENYDYIFIDFPPAHNVSTMLYMVACDYLIVPMHLAKNSSTKGYQDLIERCKEAREDYGNTSLKILGLFYNGVQLYKSDQKLLYDASMEEEIRDSMRLFRSTIRFDYASIQISEGEQKPLCISCPNADIVKDYHNLKVEMEERIRRENTNG